MFFNINYSVFERVRILYFHLQYYVYCVYSSKKVKHIHYWEEKQNEKAKLNHPQDVFTLKTIPLFWASQSTNSYRNGHFRLEDFRWDISTASLKSGPYSRNIHTENARTRPTSILLLLLLLLSFPDFQILQSIIFSRAFFFQGFTHFSCFCFFYAAVFFHFFFILFHFVLRSHFFFLLSLLYIELHPFSRFFAKWSLESAAASSIEIHCLNSRASASAL